MQQFYTISGVVNMLTCAGIATVLLTINPRSRLVRLFVAFIAELLAWSVFYHAWSLSRDREMSEFLVRTVMIAVALMPATFLQFVVELTRRPWPPWIHWFNHALGILFATQVYTPWFAPYGSPGFLFFAVWPYAGPVAALACLHFAANFLGAQWIMFRALRAETGVLRTQISAVFWGNFLAVTTGSTNWLPWFRHLLPALEGIPPLLPPFISLFVVVYAWAIVRHQLMDIEVVVKRTLVFAGLVGTVVTVVSLVTFLAQDVVSQVVAIPKIWSNVLAAAIIAALYGRVRAALVNATEGFLFQRRYDYKQLLKQFSDEVIVTMDLTQVVRNTVRTLSETLKIESCGLLLLNRETRRYELVASRGLKEPSLSLAEQEPFVRLLRDTHEPVGTDAALGRVRFLDEVATRMAQLKASVCLPLRIHAELKGILCLGKKRSDEEFTQDDLDVLSPLSQTLAIAVSNAQLFADLSKTQAEAAQKEKLAVIGSLSAGINHEIRNPLGIIKAQCETFVLDWQDGLLKDQPWQDVLQRCLTIMRGTIYHVDRAAAITQKLSNFAKPIHDTDVQPVSVAEELEEVLTLVNHELTLEQITVTRDIQPGLAGILADRRQIQEVLFNLIRNAGQAIQPPGAITIRAFGQGGRVHIHITDTGMGIPAEHLEKIYDPFFTTKEPGKGTGLGLFLVRQIVERNRGRIGVTSAVGKGTTFSLEFPSVESHVEVTQRDGRSP